MGLGLLWINDKANRSFISTQSLSHLCLAYTAGLNFTTQVCVLVDGVREMTKSGVPRPKFLISLS